MKQIILFFATIFAFICGKELKADGLKDKKILIAYYSNSGNTEAVANAIHEKVGGDIFKIELKTSYPNAYRELTEVAKQQLNDGILVELKNKVENIEQYDIVFIGSPNWWGTISVPVRSFLSQHDLSNKRVIPFVTNGGGGKQNTINDLKTLCKDCNVEEDAWIGYGSTKIGLNKWINNISEK